MEKAWRIGWIAWVCALMCASATAQTGDAEAVSAAQAAAKDWLALVDAGRYAESWDETAAPMKAAITRAAWESTSNAVRKPLGAMKFRNLKSARFTRNLPGAPQGEYVVIVYDSAFENFPAATETVAPMRDKDGKWRVSGYFIRQAALPGPAGEISDDELRAILKERVEVAQQAVGIVVGIVDEKGQRIVAHGKPHGGSARSVDGDTVFEIGSITKVFTALLLADMVERGEVALDDPVSRYLPTGTKAPRAGGKEITLLQLATHRSGLPRMPSNFAPADPDNPYEDYTADRMYQFLGTYESTAPAAPQPLYSNLGFGLLGILLSRRAGTDYESLLRTRILEPLGMKDTSIVLNGGQLDRRATGHLAGLQATSAWDFDAFAGAGAIRSTAKDMLKFAAANLGLVHSPLDNAMRAMRRPVDPQGTQGLAWAVLQDGNEVMHNGMTGGFAAEIILDLRRKKGVVVLSNTAHSNGDLAMHAMDSRLPLLKN
jgi:D-alanyl-D-alanine-carboxypeptidase/D-alanyl-D-alanine-endopeptidase